MKKLITILFLFAFTVNAQFQLSEDWSFKKDKQYHVYAGTGIAGLTFLGVYKNTSDAEWARHVSIFVGISAGFGKEFLDGINGKEIMLSDLGYTSVASIATGWLFYGGTKLIEKRKQKKVKKLLKFEDTSWSLENEFINKKF